MNEVTKGQARERIERAGRAPVLGWIDRRRVPVNWRGANVRETIHQIRTILKESANDHQDHRRAA